MPFTYDASTGRYRAAGGHLVSEQSVRRALDQVIDAESVRLRAATQLLIDGGMDLATWQLAAMQSIKSLNLIGVALAVGGWSQMDAEWNGVAGQKIREQYRFLNGFVRDLASGRQLTNGTALSRIELYAQAARATHQAAQRRLAGQQDMQEEKSSLGSADHCGQCLSEAGRGWQPLGTLSPPGSRTCLSRCHCWLSYRSVAPAA